MALGLFIFAPWLAEHTINAPHLAGVLRIGALILFINALNGAQTGALSGFEAFRTIASCKPFCRTDLIPYPRRGAYFGGLTGAVWAWRSISASIGSSTIWLCAKKPADTGFRSHS